MSLATNCIFNCDVFQYVCSLATLGSFFFFLITIIFYIHIILIIIARS